MDEILGFIYDSIIAGIGYLTYGTKDKLGHIFWRYLFRFIVFGGSALAMISLLWPAENWLPIWGWIVWSLGAIGIVSIEHDAGSSKITVMMLVCMAVPLVTLLCIHFVL